MASGSKKIIDKYKKELESEEQKKWETGGYHGENPRAMNDKEAEAWKRAKATVHPTSIRLPPQLLAELKTYAEEEGLGLHALIRMILTRAVRDRKSA